MDGIGSGLIAIAVFGFLSFMVWHGSREKLEKRRLRIEEQSRILDRIGNGAELAEFLKSEEGKQFLSQLNEADDDPRGFDGYKRSIIGLVTGGLIVSFLSASFFVLAEIYSDTFIVPAVIVCAVGIALLIAALSQYVMGKRWGMLGPGQEKDRPRGTLE